MIQKIGLSLIGLLVLAGVSIAAMPAPQIFVDLEEDQSSNPARIIDGVMMVPVLPVVKKIGCTTHWVAAKQQLEVTRPHEKFPGLILNIGKKKAFYSKYVPEIKDFVGSEEVLPLAPVQLNGVVYAPLNFLAAGLGYTLDNNVDNNAIYLFSPRYMENQKGEGIGVQAVPLTKEEKKFVVDIGTTRWTQLDEQQQNDVIAKILQWWASEINLVPDADFSEKLGRQMGQYFRTKTEIGVFETACELEGLDFHNFVDKKW